MNYLIMDAPQLVRYAKPETDLEQALLEKLNDVTEDQEELIGVLGNYSDIDTFSNKTIGESIEKLIDRVQELERELSDSQDRIEDLIRDNEVLQDQLSELEQA